jgi:excisionase family DNA binding protein
VPTLDEVLTTKEVAEALGVTQYTVRRWRAIGILKAVKHGYYIFYERAEVERFRREVERVKREHGRYERS